MVMQDPPDHTSFRRMVSRGFTPMQVARQEQVDIVAELLKPLPSVGDDVSVLQMLGFALTMVAGGNDTTTGLLGVTLELLTAHPDQRRLLLERPDLVTDEVEEFLRLASPLQGLARTTTRDVTLRG